MPKKRREGNSPPQKNKKDKYLLGEKEVYRLILQHPNVKPFKNLSVDELKIIFRAYRDIMLIAIKQGYRFAMPFIGDFYLTRKSGHEAGYITYCKKFGDMSDLVEKFYPAKGETQTPRFDIRRSLSKQFENEMRVELTEEELKASEQRAIEKRAERLLRKEEEQKEIDEMNNDIDEEEFNEMREEFENE